MKATKTGSAILAFSALGIVFGDIGTSPLYVLQAIFGPIGHNLAITELHVLGVTSLILWTITLVVAVKYLAVIMRADNHGEGGIMALIGLLQSSNMPKRKAWFFVLLGLLGVSLFYGDSAITPAISVLSAVEGLKLIAPGLHTVVLPVSLAVLTFLFAIQRYGTAAIGRFFAPVMTLWFTVIAAGGLWQIIQHQAILHALNPLSASRFVTAEPLVAFVIMGAIVLAITGVEALYADMGHFNRRVIARAWFWVVFPALVLNYLGQAALVLADPTTINSPFFLLYPGVLHIPIIMLAMLATLIASQSVISGAFSLTRQAVQLGFLPRLIVRHTSDHEIGQVYVPAINGLLFVAVILLVLVFGSSAHLASAYGVAVSGTLAADTILFIVVMRALWHKSLLQIVLTTWIFVLIDTVLVTSNLPKILHGGLFPALLALAVFTILTTWWHGREITRHERRMLEEPLQQLINELHDEQKNIVRVPGQAVYIGHHAGQTPLALRTAVEKLHELQERVVIVTVSVTAFAHVAEADRAVFDDLGYEDGISQVQLSYGYHDHINVPRALEDLRGVSREMDFDLDAVTYFVSLSRVSLTRRHNLAFWRKSLFALLARNSLSSSDYYRLPVERTVEIRSLLKL